MCTGRIRTTRVASQARKYRRLRPAPSILRFVSSLVDDENEMRAFTTIWWQDWLRQSAIISVVIKCSIERSKRAGDEMKVMFAAIHGAKATAPKLIYPSYTRPRSATPK